jgi:hypothetical protein
MRKLIPSVVVLTIAPATVVPLTKPSGDDRVMRVERVCAGANGIGAHATVRRAS